MKKMILILILVIPVMIALVITLLAGFVAREVNFPDIISVEIPKNLEPKMYAEFQKHGSYIFWESDEHRTYTVDKIKIGEDIPLKNFIVLNPSKSKFAGLQYRYVTVEETSPVQIDNYGYLRGLRESDEPVTVEICIGTTRHLTFIIEMVVK